MKRCLLTLLSLSLASVALCQWKDVQKLGTGGEAFVSTDGKGNVYATSHEPAKLYVSHDFGKTFAISHDLPESMCDVCSTVAPDGRLYVIYIRPGVSGMQVVTSSDKGANIEKAGALLGSYDREWIVVHPTTGQVGFDYSDGYIGGPKSKGVFYASSSDEGKTFKTLARIDREPAGSYPVDPYLTIGSEGRIYAGWATTADCNKIDKYKAAVSNDGGKTWTNQTEIGATHAAFGDTQERWMLGSIAAVGKDTAMMVYQDYLSLTVDGKEVKPLLAFYRVTTDGGQTWSSPKPCLSPKEIEQTLHDFLKAGGPSALVGTYCQTLPWICSDPKGRIHLAFVDNRSGTSKVNDKTVGLWHVRTATWDPASGFGASERVSSDWAAIRPPLDFLSCCSDGDNMWVIWTENPEKVAGWDFSGELYIGHKSLQ
ncbi:MAG TPA: sialidase family protein [Fimbriimonadaceae bacterium]|nr:sialidase family protein [Fimbriimonadaceae bacterium]